MVIGIAGSDSTGSDSMCCARSAGRERACSPLQPQPVQTAQGLLCTAASITLRHTEENGRRLPVRSEYQPVRSLYRTMS